MLTDEPGILMYLDAIKETSNGNFIKGLFQAVLENKPIHEQIFFYIKNIEQKKLSYTLRKSKNEKTALEHREAGNRFFSEHSYLSALTSYNKSIAYGKKLENISICYANRSAIYFELGMFEKTLENIDMAKNLKYPSHLMHKLNKRYADAKKGLLSSEKTEIKFKIADKLTRPASKKQPFIINCLKGSNLNDVKRRKIETDTELFAGDIISREVRPFSQLLSQELIYSHCTYCLSTDALMSMIPCKFCVSAMFCNDVCYGKAFESFHKVECPIIDAMRTMLTDTMWLGLRTVLKAFDICGSIDKYEKFFTADLFDESPGFFEQNFPHFGNERNTEFHDLDQYKAILRLPVNEEFHLENLVGAAFAMKLLRDNTKMVSTENFQFLANAIFETMRITHTNALLLEETYSTMGLMNQTKFCGRALYPFACNFSLCCAPNVLLMNHNNSMIGVVIRPILAGGVLEAGLVAINHITGDLSYRRNLIKEHLGRSCDCTACTQNYLRMEQLKVCPNVPQPTMGTTSAMAALFDQKGEATMKHYRFFCDYLNKHRNLDYLSLQIAGATSQLMYTLGKMIHPPAIEMKISKAKRQMLR